MICSRSLDDLLPEVASLAKEHDRLCQEAGLDLLIYCTYRDFEWQAGLYQNKRTAEEISIGVAKLRSIGREDLAKCLETPQKLSIVLPAKTVTWALPGYSFHQYRRAYDCVPMVGGKPVWSLTTSTAPVWMRVGEIGEKLGLEWAYRWPKQKREVFHFQLTGGKTIQDLLSGR